MKRPLKVSRSADQAARLANTERRDASVAAPSRRDFVRWLTAGLCLPFALDEEAFAEAASGSQALPAQAVGESSSTARTESDVGSLWPFIQSQAVAGEFPLSWLRPEFKSLASWKRKARGKLLELLHYSPAKCDPRAEVVERIDAGAYMREKVYFNTTPEIRVPAFVLVPKQAKLPRRRSWRCTITAGFISGAKRRSSRPRANTLC